MIIGVKEITIDGTTLMAGGTPWTPNPYQVHTEIAQSLVRSSGLPSLEAWWCGDGLPNVHIRHEFALTYEMSDANADVNTYLATLRAAGGTHTLCDWRPEQYMYTARAGQQLFYLPVPDAYGHASHNDAQYAAQFWRNGVALTVLYKPVVSAGDAVPAGEVWIAETPVTHGEAGFLVTTFKLGTPSAIYDEILAESIPLYRVGVIGMPTVPFEGIARETKTVMFAQVRG